MLSISHFMPSIRSHFFAPAKGTAAIPQKLPSQQEMLERLANLKPEERDAYFQKSLPQFIESLDIKTLNAMIRAKIASFTTAAEHAAKDATFASHIIAAQSFEQKPVESSMLFRFFFNLVDTFASAINFYDESNPPSSIYEKQVLIMIYYRFFQIPFALSLLLQPIMLVAWKAYLVSMAILAAISALIYVHLKWFRPFPVIIPSCEINKDLVKREYQKPINELEDETESLISYLNRSTTRPVMVLGETGSGKTTLLHKLQQRINAGIVPPALRNKKIVTIHGGTLMAKSRGAGFGDRLNQIKYALSGFEKQTIIHIDECQAVAKNEECFEDLKRFIRTFGLQCVTSTTWKAFKEVIIPADRDRSFRRSFGPNYIFMEKWEAAQVESILGEMALDAPDVYFTDDALKRIVELTDEILPELPQPAKAIELLEKIINENRKKYELPLSEEPILKRELKIKRAELNCLESKRQCHWPIDKPEEKLQRDRLSMEISTIEKTQRDLLKKRSFVRSLTVEKNKLKKQLINDSLALQAAHKKKQVLDGGVQKRYLFYFFFLLPKLMELIEEQTASLGLQIDKEFVDAVFQDYKDKKETVHHHKLAESIAGIIENPAAEVTAATIEEAVDASIDKVTDAAVKEVKKAFELVASVPHSGGKPTFQDLLRERWVKNEALLKNCGFETFDIYEEVVCNACNVMN